MNATAQSAPPSPLAEAKALFEAALAKAEKADPSEVPFPLVGDQAALWHRAQASALQWVLEMLPIGVPVKLSPVALAVIGQKHFGNPIPRAWYNASKELLTAVIDSEGALAAALDGDRLMAIARETGLRSTMPVNPIEAKALLESFVRHVVADALAASRT
jgi:hypothetical protein